MLNMLVVEDDISQLINITNFVSKSNPNIRLYSMATCGEEALYLINNTQIDLILLDLNLPDLSGVDILNNILLNHQKKYIKSVIIVSGDNRLIAKTYENPCIHGYVYKPYSERKILEEISSIIKLKEDQNHNKKIREKIISELKELNYNFSYNGTKYLVECISEAYHLGDIYNINLNKDIYSIIAQKYNKSINNIKCNITQATKEMYYDCNEKTLAKYSPFFYTTKPKVKEIIFAILSKL